MEDRCCYRTAPVVRVPSDGLESGHSSATNSSMLTARDEGTNTHTTDPPHLLLGPLVPHPYVSADGAGLM